MSLEPPFENAQVDIDQIPDIGELKWTSLDGNYIKVRLIVWFIFFLVAMTVYVVLLKWVDWQGYRGLFISIALPVLAFLILLGFIVSYFGFYQMAYAVREKDILYKKGLIFRKTTIIPFNRVQHCEVYHGPVDRIFTLASLKIYTAGGQSSDLEIPGITEKMAHLLKDHIIGKTGSDEEE